MRTKFVNTENVKRLQAAMVALGKRGAVEASLLVLDGEPGLGKTTTLQNWVAQNQCPYLRAKKTWTPNRFLNELLELFNVRPPHSAGEKYTVALRELSARQSTAVTQGRQFALVIDEADHFSNRADIMETIRDLSDMLEMTVIIVGMGKVRDHLTRFPQIASRVSQYVKFEKASEADVRAMVEALCEIPVADDLLKFIYFVSGGMNREVLEAISKVEAFGKRLGGDAALAMSDMAGQMIINDRRTGEPVYVPEAI